MSRRLLMGPFSWRVVFLFEPRDSGGERVIGTCDATKHVIEIRRALPPIQKAGALLHEALHAAFETSGLKQSVSRLTEERIVAALEPQLLDAFRRNRWFARIIIGEES